MAFDAEFVEGVRRTDYRTLVVLTTSEDCGVTVNAKGCLSDLAASPKSYRELKTRFDYWIDGDAPHPKYFHGWKDSRWRGLFVFKWIVDRVHQRLYGFLCNENDRLPRQVTCVLVTHDTKGQWNTDQRILRGLSKLRTNRAVILAVRTAIGGGGGGVKKSRVWRGN